MARAFIAVDISQEARVVLAETVKRAQEQGVTGVRWVRPEAVHLTLEFLGEIEPSLVESILGAMEGAARGTGPIALGLSGIGAFPSMSNPRVIWVGVNGDLGLLSELQARIDEAMYLSCSFPREERAFSPHLTLGRLRERQSANDRSAVGRALARVTLDVEIRWQVDQVHLVRSTLTPSGAEYDLLGSRRL